MLTQRGPQNLFRDLSGLFLLVAAFTSVGWKWGRLSVAWVLLPLVAALLFWAMFRFIKRRAFRHSVETLRSRHPATHTDISSS